MAVPWSVFFAFARLRKLFFNCNIVKLKIF